MKIERLTDYVSTRKSVAAAIPSSAAITATAVDAQGFDRARHVIQLGAFGATSTFDAEVLESATTGGTYTKISGADMTGLVSTGAGKAVIIDVTVNSAKPFQKLRGTAGVSTVALAAICDLYNGSRTLPADDDTSIAENVFVA